MVTLRLRGVVYLLEDPLGDPRTAALTRSARAETRISGVNGAARDVAALRKRILHTSRSLSNPLGLARELPLSFLLRQS